MLYHGIREQFEVNFFHFFYKYKPPEQTEPTSLTTNAALTSHYELCPSCLF